MYPSASSIFFALTTRRPDRQNKIIGAVSVDKVKKTRQTLKVSVRAIRNDSEF